jgi:hypothetical protein
MDRQATLLQMAKKMNAAIAAEDWKLLAAMNTLVASTLPHMAAQGKWSGAERAALAALHEMHQEAVRRCGLATEELGRRLDGMQANKEGWLAYALDSEQADNGIQA